LTSLNPRVDQTHHGQLASFSGQGQRALQRLGGGGEIGPKSARQALE
jgi:hypothetical protein